MDFRFAKVIFVVMKLHDALPNIFIINTTKILQLVRQQRDLKITVLKMILNSNVNIDIIKL